MAVNLLTRSVAECSNAGQWLNYAGNGTTQAGFTASHVLEPDFGIDDNGIRHDVVNNGGMVQANIPSSLLYAQVIAGVQYTHRVQVKNTTASTRIYKIGSYWNNGGAGVMNGDTVTLGPGDTGIVHCTQIAPVGATDLRPVIQVISALVGDTFLIGAQSIHEGASIEYMHDFSAPDPGTVTSIATQEQYETRYGEVPGAQRNQLQAILDEVSVMARHAAGDAALWPLGTDAPDAARVLVLMATRRALQNPAGIQSESNPEGYSYSYAGGFASATGYFTKVEREILEGLGGYSGIGSIQFVTGRAAAAYYMEPVADGGDPIPWIEGQ